MPDLTFRDVLDHAIPGGSQWTEEQAHEARALLATIDESGVDGSDQSTGDVEEIHARIDDLEAKLADVQATVAAVRDTVGKPAADVAPPSPDETLVNPSGSKKASGNG